MAIDIVPNEVPVGAEIRGIDLASGVSDNVFDEIRRALHAHGVIFLRDQHLDPARHVAFARRLGTLCLLPLPEILVPGHPELSRVSNIVEDGKPIGLVEAGQYWHSDLSFRPVPAGYSIMHAVEVPRDAERAPRGGTMFASGAAAYDSLPGDLKQRISGLRALHHGNNPYSGFQYSAFKLKHLPDDWDATPPAEHPVVRLHPHTGRKCLYVNARYTVGITGMAEAEGRALIDLLCAHSTRAEAVYHHHWREGDLLVWDDCMVQHHAVADYALPQRRLIVKAMVEGRPPIAMA